MDTNKNKLVSLLSNMKANVMMDNKIAKVIFENEVLATAFPVLATPHVQEKLESVKEAFDKIALTLEEVKEIVLVS